MNEKDHKRREAPADAQDVRPSPGKVSRLAAEQAARGKPRGTPVTAGAVAEAAVAEKDSGAPLGSEVQARVGQHLGADFSDVRVHQDQVSTEANQALGARAFAHGGDIFLGERERATDVSLMAHELTHVVQQGAARKATPQPDLEVEPANSPAEREADRVASEVSTAQPVALIVDGEAASGQMSRADFLARLRADVTRTADEALGPLWSAAGCPYIDRWFEQHRQTDAATLERLARRYSYLINAASAEAYIVPICARVRRGIETWRAGGDVSSDLAAAGMGAEAAAVPSVEEASPPGTAAAKIGSFGPGEPLESTTAARMGAALDTDFADVEVHTGPEAAAASAAEGARAVAIGQNIAFAAGAYQPGTPQGDALLAHELAHTEQQREAAGDPRAMLSPLGKESAAHEDAADVATGGAMSRLWSRISGGTQKVTQRASEVVRSPLQLQRCSGGTEPLHEFTPNRVGPHIGQRVGVLAEGGNMVTQEFVHTAVETIGEAQSETEAITMAKVANVPAAIIASDGVFFVYRISVYEDLLGNTVYNPILIANAGLRVDDGVIAIVANANVYRTGLHQGTVSTDATRESYQETFEPYLALHDGNLSEASEPEFLAVFQAAMRDNALAVLAESQRQAEDKRDQFGAGVGALSAGERTTIEETANEALRVQTAAEAIDDRRWALSAAIGRSRGSGSAEQWEELTELGRQHQALETERRQINLGYPMLGRYESAASLREFIARDDAGRIAALAGDAESVLANIATTRTNILTGDLNLWLVPPVINSTIAGLHVAEDTDQRRWVDAKAQAQGSRDRNAQIALAVLSIGLGLAAAFATGGAALILTAGAVGVGVYDAVRTTEDYFVRDAGTDTDIDRIDGASLLPEDMRQHWGWLVIAWVGVGLDALDVARVIGQVGRATRGRGLIDEAAQALAAGDAQMLARLRRAAGDIDIAETISEGNRAAVSRAVGAEVSVDPRAGRSVEVLYEVDEATGRVAVSGVRVGSAASVGDIVAHADTVRMLRRHGTLSERIHDLWTRMRTFGREGSANPFDANTAAFESFEELRKLEDLAAVRRAQLREALAAGEEARPAQDALRRQLAFLENEYDIHRRVVDSLSDARGGRGFVAMSDDTRAALEAGNRLPDFPDRALGDLSDADLQSSAYYFRRADDGTYETVLKADRTAAEVTPTGPVRTPAEISARADRVRGALPNASGLTDDLLDALAEIPDATLARISRAPAGDLANLGGMLKVDPTLATRLGNARNPLGAISGLTGVDPIELSAKLFNQRIGDAGIGAGRGRILDAARRTGVPWSNIDAISEADLRTLGRADTALAAARQSHGPGRAAEAGMREAQAAIDGLTSVDSSVKNALRAELSHAHGLSDIPFMLDPAAALRARFPPTVIPETAMRQLGECHPDALRALETASADDIREIVRLLTAGDAGRVEDVNDILRSYMYKAQKAARRGDGTLTPPATVAARLEESVDTLAVVRERGFPFGFAGRAEYDQFMAATREGLGRRGISGTPQVQGSAMHSRTPGDVDMEIVVSQAEFERLAEAFTAATTTGRQSRELAEHVGRGKIPSSHFFPHARPSLAEEVRGFTRAEGGTAPLDVQATLIVQGSDFDLGPFL